MTNKNASVTEAETPRGTTHVAVLGTGSIGSRHLEVLNEAAGFSTIAVPLRPTRAKELASQGQKTASGLAEAAIQGATVCIIATETGRHLEDGKIALDCGLDLLVEKPLALTAVQSAKLIEHAEKSGRSLYVGCVMRFSESLGTFREYLPQVGELHSVRIECQSYLPDWRPQRSYLESYAARTHGGGVLLDLIHEVDYAGWIYGWPDTVQGRIRNLGRLGIKADEAVDLSWETPAGCLISINLDYLSRQPRRIMRAYGALGTLEWDGFGGTVTLLVEGADPIVKTSHQSRNDTFLAQAQAFIKVSNGGHDIRLATAEEGARGLAVCDSVRKASTSRRDQPVSYP